MSLSSIAPTIGFAICFVALSLLGLFFAGGIVFNFVKYRTYSRRLSLTGLVTHRDKRSVSYEWTIPVSGAKVVSLSSTGLWGFYKSRKVIRLCYDPLKMNAVPNVWQTNGLGTLTLFATLFIVISILIGVIFSIL